MKLFGTDGIRGKFNETPITHDDLVKIGYAFAKVIFGEDKDETDVIKRIDALKGAYPNVEFIMIDYSIPDYKQMLIMSNCKYNIIANSTFSCWAGYLNMNEDRVVIYPKRWFGEKNSDKNTSDLFLDEWLCVSE